MQPYARRPPRLRTFVVGQHVSENTDPRSCMGIVSIVLGVTE